MPKLRMRLVTLLVGVLLSTTLAFPTRAQAGTLSRDVSSLLRLAPQAPAPLIVQTNGAPSDGLLLLVRLLGGVVYAKFESINGFAVVLPLNTVTTLVARADVNHISTDLPVLGMLDLSTTATSATAARQQTGLDGSGVGVAVIDTGVGPHPDLTQPTNRIVGWKDLVNGKSSPYDDSGHGTHVAGIIAGNGSSAATLGRDLRGVAPKANIIGVKVLNSQMQGTASLVIKGLDFVRANKQKYNIGVVNLSLGQPVRESAKDDPLCRAVETLWKSGVVVVCSAGNLGRKDPNDQNGGARYGTITCPGNDPLALTVGATRTNYTGDRSDDEMASYSSRGPSRFDHTLKPDVVAPGNKVLSTVVPGTLTAANPGGVVGSGSGKYMALSGTSMAAPMVAGAAALMLQKDASLTPDTIKIRLMHSAVKQWNASAPYSPFSRGAGLLNVVQALKQTERATKWAYSPTVIRGTQAGTFTFQGSDSLYGDGFLWGDEAAQQNSSSGLSGDGFLWGDEAASSSSEQSACWGDGFLWGDEAASAESSSSFSGDGFLWGDEACYSPNASDA